MEINNRQNIFLQWLLWHFVEMPRFLLQTWYNYLSFASNFFSLKFLLKTFFSPWRRYKWKYPKGFQVSEFLSTLLSNSFSRVLGAFMRIILIFLGIIFQIFTLAAGAAVILIWMIIPFMIIAGFIFIFFY